jgi:hypothetical protein
MKQKMLWFCEEGATYFIRFQIKRPATALCGWGANELEDLWDELGHEIVRIKLKKGKVYGG